jgi:large subunit ribosomal protein L10
MKKEDKQIIVNQLGETLKEYAHFYLVDVAGMNAEATSSLRRKCFQQGIKMLLVKNTLLHKAFEASEIDYTPLYDCLKGTTAVFFCNVANVPAKLIKEENKKKNEMPALKAAYAEEGFYVGANQLDALCAIKSKTEVLAEVVALLQSPAKNVISALQGAAGQKIHRVLKTLGERPE